MHQNLYPKSIAPMVTSSMNATFQLPERAPTDAQLAQSNLRLRIGAHIDRHRRAAHYFPAGRSAAHEQSRLPYLIELIRHAGDTVTRDQLLDRVWTRIA